MIHSETPTLNNYKSCKSLQMKTILGNAAYFATLTWFLLTRFAPFVRWLQAVPPYWL
jgi:hypothetical protein